MCTFLISAQFESPLLTLCVSLSYQQLWGQAHNKQIILLWDIELMWTGTNFFQRKPRLAFWSDELLKASCVIFVNICYFLSLQCLWMIEQMFSLPLMWVCAAADRWRVSDRCTRMLLAVRWPPRETCRPGDAGWWCLNWHPAATGRYLCNISIWHLNSSTRVIFRWIFRSHPAESNVLYLYWGKIVDFHKPLFQERKLTSELF